MTSDDFSGDESRKLAVLMARIWANAKLEDDYLKDPEAVLQDMGISLAGRTPPSIPPKPAELAAHSIVAAAGFSSASSISCATCPCSGCTASCACGAREDLRETIEIINKLAADPGARDQARKLWANWDVKIRVGEVERQE